MLISAHLGAVCGVVAILLAAVVAVFWHKTLYHFRTVERGRLYRSGVPGPVGLWLMWRLYGIRTIVNLASEQDCRRGRWYEREREFCRKKGIELVHIPLQPAVDPDASQTGRFLSVIQGDAPWPVLVHCMQGVARTNMMVTVYLKARFGLPNEQILKQLPTFGHRFTSRRYDKMRKFVLRYQPQEDAERSIPSAN